MSGFFMYIFPVIFSYTGPFFIGPKTATISLAAGIIGWLLFNMSIIWTYIIGPTKMKRQLEEVEERGLPVKASVVSKSLIHKNRKGSESIEVEISFPNFSGTIIKSSLSLIDSRPHENRFEKGKTINIRLNRDTSALPLVLEGSQYQRNYFLPLLWTLFNTAFAVVYFLISYRVFSNGMGWRFLTPWYPWVFMPYLGLFLHRILGAMLAGGFSIETKGISNKMSVEVGNALILYGIQGIAEITKAKQTGLFINEQPEILYSIHYVDKKGETHYNNLKKVTSLLEVHRYAEGDLKPILYLEKNPDVFILLPSE